MSQLALLGGPKAASRPFPDWPIWDDDDRRAVLGVLDSGKWWMYAYGDAELGAEEDAQSNRSQVEQFEEEFAALHRVKRCIAVTSGSAALEICVRAAGLGRGDEVITTPYTFFATTACILSAGALPVYADIDPRTYNIDPARIEEAITDRTRAILPVHFSGELCDVEAIADIARRYGLAVIEDAAQSQGVCLEGDRYAGSFGDAGIFSFQQSKCLTCGEGGAILTDSEDFAERAWSLRHYGRTRGGLWYEHHRLGWNARMTEFSGALLRTQLRKLEAQNALRAANVKHLYRRMREIDGIEPVDLHPRGARRGHYLVMLRYDPEAWQGLPRDRFLGALNAEGVPAAPGYSFLNFENPVFKTLDLTASLDYERYGELCPNAVRACRQEAVWLMHNMFLGDTGHVDMIVAAIAKVKENCAALL